MLITIAVPEELLQQALAELPAGSKTAAEIRIVLAVTAGAPPPEPIAYLAHRRTGAGAGKQFVTKATTVYDQNLYEGPYPVFAQNVLSDQSLDEPPDDAD